MTEPRQHPGQSRQDYGTPPALLEAVKAYLGVHDFECDLAASDDNAVTHHGYCTEKDDALSLDSWRFGPGWNWLNPPFSKIGPWVAKAHHEWIRREARTVMLVPAAVGSKWWREYVHHKAGVLFINPRLTFVGCVDPFPKDCALLFYGCASSYDVWTWRKSERDEKASSFSCGCREKAQESRGGVVVSGGKMEPRTEDVCTASNTRHTGGISSDV